MTDEEWQKIDAMLGGWWAAPGPFEPGESAMFRMALDRLDPTALAKVLAGMLSARPSPFRPSPAEITQALLPPSRSAAHGEAWALIRQASSKVGSIYAQDFGERHQAAIDWLAGQDPAVALWAARRGLCGPGSLGVEPTEDPEWGGAVLKRLSVEYGDVAKQVDDRLARGLPAVDPAQLRVRGTGAGPGGMGELLDRLRPKDVPELGPGE